MKYKYINIYRLSTIIITGLYQKVVFKYICMTVLGYYKIGKTKIYGTYLITYVL